MAMRTGCGRPRRKWRARLVMVVEGKGSKGEQRRRWGGKGLVSSPKPARHIQEWSGARTREASLYLGYLNEG